MRLETIIELRRHVKAIDGVLLSEIEYEKAQQRDQRNKTEREKFSDAIDYQYADPK